MFTIGATWRAEQQVGDPRHLLLLEHHDDNEFLHKLAGLPCKRRTFLTQVLVIMRARSFTAFQRLIHC